MFDPKKMLDMLKNTSDIQKNMQEKLKNQRANGEALGGMVKVVMNGQFEVESISIEDKLLSEDKKFIEDVIKAAINDASHQLRTSMADQLKNLMGGFGL